jgi:hypothetical protein
MLPTHRIRIIARLCSNAQSVGRTRAVDPSDFSKAPPDWDTSAVYWETSEAAIGPVFGTDLGQTLTVIYDAEGRDSREAALFARAIFEWEWKRTALPPPATLAVFPE